MSEKNFFQILTDEVPGINDAFFGLIDSLQKDAGLDEKTFQLVYIGIQTTKGNSSSVAAHSALAKKAGASREEVRGAVLISLMTSGINGVASCLAVAMDSYDNA